MSKPTKCNPKKLCPAMHRSCVPFGNSHCKGLVLNYIMDLKTGVFRTVGIAYKTKANDPGILLNTCPWCGANLRWWKRYTKEVRKHT